MVYARASDLGATGTESPGELDGRRDVVEAMESIRALAAARIGLGGSRAIPKVAILAAPTDAAIDVVVRMLSMGKTHRTLAMTTAICTAVAAAVPGTLVAELARPAGSGQRIVRLGHPAGVLPIGADVRLGSDGTWHAKSVTAYRTARKIMDGCVYVPASYLEGKAWFQRGTLATTANP